MAKLSDLKTLLSAAGPQAAPASVPPGRSAPKVARQPASAGATTAGTATKESTADWPPGRAIATKCRGVQTRRR